MLGALVLLGAKARELLPCCNVADGFWFSLGCFGISVVIGSFSCLSCFLYTSYMLRDGYAFYKTSLITYKKMFLLVLVLIAIAIHYNFQRCFNVTLSS
jgi:hypothetical protein